MKHTQSAQTNPVAEAANVISGAYAAPLVDALLEICEDDSMQEICNAIAALGEESRTIEAVQLIRALMDIAKIDCPQEIELLDENETGRDMFVGEFVADLNDILYGV
jgi:hypothetical protein